MQSEKLISDAETGSATKTYEKELETLCTYLESEQINVEQVRVLVNDNNGILDVVLHKHRGKNIVQMACSNFAKYIAKGENLRVLRTLISQSNLFYSNKAENSQEAIHYAAVSCEERILQTILEAIKEDEENADKINATTANGETALVLILKKRANKSLNCVRALLNAGVDIDVSDHDGSTAILLACKKLDNYESTPGANVKDVGDIIEIIKLLVTKACCLDSYELKFFPKISTKSKKSETAREFIIKYQEKYFNEMVLPSLKTPYENTYQCLFRLLKEGQENDFLNHPLLENYANAQSNTMTLLQLACAKEYKECVDKLLKFGADPNVNTKKNDYPLGIACRKGHVGIFTAVLKKSRFNTSSVLLEITKNLYQKQNFQINHETCLKELLKHKPCNYDVNYKDHDGSTPLHCSTKMRRSVASLKLLQNGALLSERNNDGEMPVHNIDIHTLEQYFDYCIHYKQERIYNNSWVTDEEKKGPKLIEINYTTLLPKTDDPFVSHMEVIAEISKKPELTPILKHPYVSSFLYLKWYRIRWFHYMNIFMYALFCLLLYLYIFFIYLNGNENLAFSLFLGFITLLLIGREIIQFTSRPKLYCRDFENWMELTLFAISFVIILGYPQEISWRKSLASFAIILSAFELVLSLGQVPTFSTYVKMLRQVSCNFIKFILWQVVLLFGFALSFYILFSDAIGTFNNDQNKTTQELNNTNEHEIPGNNELDMFQNISLSVVKTVVMLTGEFDASSIKFQLYPFTSILIFLAFVFMISMVVFNLLNGLAISDIQEIREHAEIVSNRSRLHYILMLESLFEKFLTNETLKRNRIIQFFHGYFFELIYTHSKFIKKSVVLLNENGVFLQQEPKKNVTVKRQDSDDTEGINLDPGENTTKLFTIWEKFFEVRLDAVTFGKIKHLLAVTKIEKKFASDQEMIKKQEDLENLFKEFMQEQKSDMQKIEERIFAEQELVKKKDLENAFKELKRDMKNMEERIFVAVREEVSKIGQLKT